MSSNKVTTVFSVLLVFILFVAIKPGDNPVILMRIASISAVIIFTGMVIYTRFLWRVMPFINLHKVIDIGGKWQGKMFFENGEEFDIQAHITQHLDDIKIRIKTNDFFNDSLACKMKTDSQGTYLYVVYKSKPASKIDSKDQIEYGTLIIKCDADFLEGSFYTSGKLAGRTELYRK